jgi:hypothetical protein
MAEKSTGTPRLALNEQELAAALGISVSFLQHDRLKRRLIPYYRLAGRVLYDRGRVMAALAMMEEGGAPAKRRKAVAA